MNLQNKSKKLNNTRILLSCLIALPLLLSGCSLLPQEEEMIAPPLVEPASVDYDLVEVQRGDITKKVTGTAYFVPVHSKNLFYEQSGGRLQHVEVKEGDIVEEGQLLAEIDTGNLVHDIEQLEIELAKADIRLKQVKGSGADSYSIELAELDKEGIELRLSQLRRQLATAQITSPIDGIITFVTAHKPGDYVDAYESIIQVADLSNLQLIYIASAANNISDVKVGMQVALQMNGEDMRGEVVQTPETVPEDVLENNSTQYSRSLLIDFPDGAPEDVQVGDSVSIEIVTERKEDTLVIPTNALREGFGRTYVHVLVDNRRRELDVEIGIESSTEVEILQGIEEGDEVILR
ncbi:efflux RND transporter periplasmic adaptor subunit [Evansella cellulosilytica]|uniref:Efflux transporter, RND family, MFP subunit n=1 Tax=Evansella cellulosilytica (strain ATCC 21833 / DSM 2522 / FERM P-1141 / JCM 9156 / N-4) TaxID=649639 RepID=E6TXI8_EVAC2|nr:efflux RND transporter periplasmic adaptor subunit [Evansella cellulosilytica]ADU28802.1 efflux transporter, RND family, MFP subunit [Evansella cellulosilytica DSM 2522]